MVRICRIASVLVLFLLLIGCTPSRSTSSVKITDYLSLEDKNGHVITYGMDRETINEMFNTGPINTQWESAHENLEIRLTSSIEHENPRVVQLSVTRQDDHPEPSWSLPQGIRIGDSAEKVLTAFGQTELTGSVLDLFFVQDPQFSAMMYEVSEKELDTLEEGAVIYRIALQFEGETLDMIVLGDLDSMA